MALHMLWTFVLKGCCLLLQLACGFFYYEGNCQRLIWMLFNKPQASCKNREDPFRTKVHNMWSATRKYVRYKLHHNCWGFIARFCSQQYQMLLWRTKAHYKHSFLYQAHLQFLWIGQILLERSICFLEVKLVFVDNIVFIKEIEKSS